jgi:hypothetical protein
MKRTLPILISVLVFGVICIGGWNYLAIARPVDSALALDSRNQGIEVRVHYQYYVDPSQLAFDLRAVSGQNSMADVFRSRMSFRRLSCCIVGTPDSYWRVLTSGSLATNWISRTLFTR